MDLCDKQSRSPFNVQPWEAPAPDMEERRTQIPLGTGHKEGSQGSSRVPSGTCILLTPWGPGVWVNWAPTLTLRRCFRLEDISGVCVACKGMELKTPSVGSGPLSCAELYKDSFQSPGENLRALFCWFSKTCDSPFQTHSV